MLSNFNNLKIFNIVDLLHYRAESSPDRKAYGFLYNGEILKENLTYFDLEKKVKKISAYLQTISNENERALLIFSPGMDFIISFYACLYAKIITVPVYPPRYNQYYNTLEHIIKDSDTRIIISVESFISQMRTEFIKFGNKDFFFIDINNISDSDEETWKPPNIKEDQIAFIQYTSGSTGNPKGVVLTHKNIMYTEEIIRNGFGCTTEDHALSWLPMYHDMGLIGGVLQSIYSGFDTIIMSPYSFIQKPVRWLQAISKYKITISGGPNSGYESCLRRIDLNSEEINSIDLSSWKVAFSGAEPIRHETLENFAETFKAFGFNKNSFYPCYGLAEATLMVSGGKRGNFPVIKKMDSSYLEKGIFKNDKKLSGKSQYAVSCGKPLLDQKIKIVNPETFKECEKGIIGEIWIAGSNVASGYWCREEDTKKIFKAYISDVNEGPFLRTGDLGVIDNEELFITGRLKDLLIIRGRNYYPQDIELSVEKCDPAIKKGAGAAFSIFIDGEERLIIAYELNRNSKITEELLNNIRDAIISSNELQVYKILIVNFGMIPKTSSGKIKRDQCKSMFINGEFDVLKEKTFKEEIEINDFDVDQNKNIDVKKWLVNEVALKLHTDPQKIDINQSIFQLYLDSLSLFELIHKIEKKFNLSLAFENLIQGSSISDILGKILPVSPITPVKREPLLPLSYPQEQMWLLSQIELNVPTYNIYSVHRVSGKLNSEYLEESINYIISRHEILRTTYLLEKNSLFQKISPELKIKLDKSDLSSIKLDQNDLWQKYIIEEIRKIFNLEKGPLIRVKLFNLAEDISIFVLTMHHIICDGWSIGLFINELTVYYNNLYAYQKLPALPDLALQYVDFALWQKNILKNELIENHLAFWKKYLNNFPRLLELPTDFTRPSVKSYKGAFEVFEINSFLTKKLREFSIKEEVTLFMLLAALFQTLLYRYSGKEDIVIGTPIAGRDKEGIKNLLGFFVNTLVIRTNFSGNPFFCDLLKEVKKSIIDVFSHHALPFQKVVEALLVERNLSYTPIFQVMLSFQNVQLDDLKFNDLQLIQMEVDCGISKFDLHLDIIDKGEELYGKLEYSTDIFTKETICNFLIHFKNIIKQVVNNPELKVSKIPLTDEAEYNKVVSVWNNTYKKYDFNKFLFNLFEEQSERNPDQKALIFENEELTYKELNEKSNQLAHYLKDKGVITETLVGICLERSLEMIISILGIIKAGGVYLPLDPDNPEERIQYILEDASLKYIITQKKFNNKLLNYKNNYLNIDEGKSLLDEYPKDNLSAGLTKDNLIYTIYTSGSTGKPKGASNTHKGVLNRILWMQDEYKLNNNDRVLQKTPYTFDVSVWEFFLPLVAGSTLVIAKPEGHKDSDYLIEIINEKQITTIHFVPSMLQIFLESKKAETCRSLKRVICSGESLSYGLQETFFRKIKAELHNLYGPTEAAVDVTYWDCSNRNNRKIVPIGKPISNVKIYILDEFLETVPVNVIGEIYIAGICLARNYLNRPDLTAEKFLPDPFSKNAGDRMYRTGDLGRWLFDGSIECQGRIDNQVKIRGFRIELGEIESVLKQYPLINDAVVISRENQAYEKQLAAYLIPKFEMKLDENKLIAIEVRSYLQKKLPDYMIPSSFTILDKLPLTTSGKVDRKSLPEPNTERADLNGKHITSQTPMEKQLTSIAEEVLNLKNINIHDNLFELGGNSLMMTRVAYKIRSIFDIDIPIKVFFENPDIYSISNYILKEQLLKNEDLLALLEESDPDDMGILSNNKEYISTLNYKDSYKYWKVKRFYVGNKLDLIYSKGSGQVEVLPTIVVDVFEDYSEFEPLEKIYSQIFEKLGKEAEVISYKKEQFENTVKNGFYISRENYLSLSEKELSNKENVEERHKLELQDYKLQKRPDYYSEKSSKEDTDSHIGYLATTTRNRVVSLKNSLKSYISNLKENNRKIGIMIFDDSKDERTEKDYQDMLSELKKGNDIDFFYFGQNEKNKLVNEITKVSKVSREIVNFALSSDWFDFSAGANLNRMLLTTSGSSAFVFDDDTYCRTMVSSEYSSGVEFVKDIDHSLSHPFEIISCNDRENCLKVLNGEKKDLLKEHEMILGQSINKFNFNNIDKKELRINNNGKIILSINGFAGDCGWISPSNYLFFTGKSLERMTESESLYRNTFNNRNIVRYVNKITISDRSSNFMTTSFGIDNRKLLPPFLPVARGQDLIFGTMLSKCFENNYIGYIPVALFHSPVEDREFLKEEIWKSAGGADFGLILNILIKTFDFGHSTLDGKEKLIKFGKYFEDIGKINRNDFEEFIYLKVLEEISSIITVLENRRELFKNVEYLAKDYELFIEQLRNTFSNKDSYIPLDVFFKRKKEDAINLFQEIIFKFGFLMKTWTEIWEASKKISDERIQISKKI